MSNMPVVMVLLLFFIAITLFKLTALALLVLTKDSIFPVGFHLLHSLDFRQDFLGNRFRNPVVKHFLGELGQVLDVLTGGSKHNDMLSAQSHVLNRQLFVHLGVHFVGSVLVVFLASAQDIGVSHAPRVELVMLDALCYLQGIAVVALGENLNNAMLLGLVQLIPEITHEHRSVEVSNVNQILLFFYVLWCFLSSATTMYSLRLRNLDRLFYHISLTFHIHHYIWLLFLFLFHLLLCCCFLLLLLFLFFELHHLFMLFNRLLPSMLPIEVALSALPFVISTPAVDFAINGAGNGVMLSSRDESDMLAFEFRDKSGQRYVFLMPDPELAMVIESESEDLALLIDVEGVMVATEDVSGFLSVDLLHSECLVVLVPGLKHSSDLSAFRVTPAVYLTIRCKSQRMMSSALDFLNNSLAFEEICSYPHWLFDGVANSPSQSILSI